MKNILIVSTLIICLISCKKKENRSSALNENIQIPETVKTSINNRVSKGINQSIVVGIIDSSGTDFYSQGNLSSATQILPDSNSQYEIGSVTKIFTGLLLAIKVHDGTVSLTDSIHELLPKNKVFPESINNITFQQLVNHTSGLRRNPINLHDGGYNAANPYAHYNSSLLFEALEKESLLFKSSTKSQYSNLGMALLGYLLTSTDDTSYVNSLESHILSPLKMETTSDTFAKSNTAQGYVFNVPVSSWDFDVLAGAGALKSNVSDMLRLLHVQLQLEENTIAEEIVLSHKKTFSVTNEKHIGMAWGIYDLDNRKILYRHNGGTAGFRSFIGFTQNPKRGVIVLTNSNAGVDDIGLHLLDESFELKTDFKESIAHSVSKILEDPQWALVTQKLDSVIETITNDLNFEWSELNTLGYSYLKKEEFRKAIAVFILNLKLYPESADGYDSLGEAYFKSKNYQESKASYKKALDLDKNYENAKSMIQKIDSIQIIM